jgi:hypothetical protein
MKHVSVFPVGYPRIPATQFECDEVKPDGGWLILTNAREPYDNPNERPTDVYIPTTNTISVHVVTGESDDGR